MYRYRSTLKDVDSKNNKGLLTPSVLQQARAHPIMELASVAMLPKTAKATKLLNKFTLVSLSSVIQLTKNYYYKKKGQCY